MIISKEIFLQCKNNDRGAQERLYTQVYSSLLIIAKRYLYNEQDAVIALNNTMFKVFTKMDQFQGDENNLFAWMKRIVVNESIDQLRRNQNFFSLEALPDYDKLFTSKESIPDQDIDINHLLAQLPIVTATVFNMFVVEGYSHREISGILNITEGNSKWHLHSARKKLQNLLTLSTISS